MGIGPHRVGIARTDNCSAPEINAADRAPRTRRSLLPLRKTHSLSPLHSQGSRTAGRSAPELSKYAVACDLPLHVPVTSDELRALEILLGHDLVKTLTASDRKVA
ncbi:MAG: hypothetical protein JO188_07955 [Hyphomicrobiales bacterium]|nr:hypothetical protein [Hyphomicrobiales bacterium]